MPVVHILAGREHDFASSTKGAPLSKRAFALDGFQWELVDDGQIDMEELLITALISIAPRRVVVSSPHRHTGISRWWPTCLPASWTPAPGCELCHGSAVPGAGPRSK